MHWVRQRPEPVRRVALFGLVALAAALMAAACASGGRGDFDDVRLQQFDDSLTAPGQPHVSGAVPYPTTPPYGGPHDPVLVRCGIYQDAQPFGRLLHTMEHGGVIWYYQPDLFNPDEVSVLRRVASDLFNRGARLVLTPSRELSAPIVLASWGRLLALQQFEEETVRAYVAAFDGKGPEDLPRANSC